MMQERVVRVGQGHAKGEVRVPTSKSIAHRALICAALCPEGERSVLSGVPKNEDVDATLDCLFALGVKMDVCPDPEDQSARRVSVYGCGGRFADVQGESGILRCRESGSTLRFLLPLCLLSENERTLTGSPRLMERPLNDYRSLFAERQWERLEQSIYIGKGAVLNRRSFHLTGNTSSQFVTGLLFVMPFMEGDVTIELGQKPESRSYIDMTLAVLARFGVRACWTDEKTLFVPKGQTYHATDLTVEGDASGASFFLALAALGGDVEVLNAHGEMAQGDSACPQMLEELTKKTKGLAVLSLADCPDLAPVLFAVAAAKRGAVFTHTARLRLKESDRIAAMAQELAKFGATVLASEDADVQKDVLPEQLKALGKGEACGGWVVVLPAKEGLHAPEQTLNGHNDHRVVMSLSVLCCAVGDGIIHDAQAVSKSFPTFFDCLRSVGIKVTEQTDEASLQESQAREFLPGGEKWKAPAGWERVFREWLYNEQTKAFASPQAETMMKKLATAYEQGEVYPPVEQVFRALYEVPYDGVRAVILGQDPYHEPGQAHGLSFSVPDGIRLPPSLRNIYRELYADLDVDPATPLPPSGDLSAWARQGVLLLNSVLTVPRGAAGGHRGMGWEQFTDGVLCALNESSAPIAFILWGKDARSKRRLLTNPDHLVLESEHPSPLSAWRGFFGSRPFSAVNEYLTARGVTPIDWLSLNQK